MDRGTETKVTRRYPLRRPKAVDFFCGAGGLSLGIEQAGFDIVLGVDQDGHHAATHERNFPYGASHCGSVIDLDGDKVRTLAKADDIDLVVGGPPCQGFSHMGLRDIKDSRNDLVFHYMRLVTELQPKAFIMENVPGLLSGETRRILDEVIEVAEAAGYTITKPVQVLDAFDFGVPQKRRRLFLLGLRNDIGGMIEYPTTKCTGQPERPTVGEAINDLPDVEKEERLYVEGFTTYAKTPKSAYAKVARGKLPDPSDLSRPRAWNDAVCTGCLRVKHAPSSVELYRATPAGETVPGHKLPKLALDGYAPTLRAGSDSTHGSYTAPRPIHPIHPRCITSREAARLHGFPDWFAFYPLKWHSYRQIGNAVCPPVARALGASVLQALDTKRTSRAPAPVPLGETFLLPEDRPRSLKRIPLLDEFPAIVSWLLDQAIDPATNVLRRKGFTFDDVTRAIEHTQSKLHWAREDNFLQEIARSRAVKKILEPVHKRGFTLRVHRKGKVIGEFVPLGTVGALEDRDSVHIRIDEIHNSVSLPMRPVMLNGTASAVQQVLDCKDVRRQVWGNARQAVKIVDAPKDSTKNRTVVYRLESGKASPPSVLVVCKAAAAITRSRIGQIATAHACDDVITFVSATSKHFVAIRYRNCLANAEEVSRIAFEMTGEV